MDKTYGMHKAYSSKSSFHLSAIVLLIAIFSSSCVRESDFDECEFPLRLQFSYTYNRENLDLLMEEVGTISLRLFDENTGELVKMTDITVNDLDSCATYVWQVPMGSYNLVSWGGIESRYQLDSDYHIDSHILRLPSDDAGNVAHQQEHLWHNLKSDIVIDGNVSPTYYVDLRKISNDLTVTVRTSDDSPLSDEVSSYVTATNNLYNALGNVHSEAREITYLPQIENGSSTSVHSYTTLGLQNADGSKLMVRYGDSVVYDGGLTDLLALTPGIIFDLDDEFNLDFEVTPLDDDGNISVDISVNGWLIVSMHVELDI